MTLLLLNGSFNLALLALMERIHVKHFRLIFNICVLTTVFTFIAVSMHRVFNAFAQEDETQQHSLAHQEPAFHFEKNRLVLPKSKLLHSSHKNMLHNEVYYLTQHTQNGSESCYFGLFKFVAGYSDHDVFQSIKANKYSKMDYFASIQEEKTKFQVLTKKEFELQRNIDSCKKWTQIINLSKHTQAPREADQTFEIKLNKCLVFDDKQFVSLISFHSHIAAIQNDRIKERIKICGLRTGNAQLVAQPSDGGKQLTILAKINSKQKTDSSSQAKTFDAILHHPTLQAGWN